MIKHLVIGICSVVVFAAALVFAHANHEREMTVPCIGLDCIQLPRDGGATGCT